MNTGKVVNKSELVQHFICWAKNWYGTAGTRLKSFLMLESIIYGTSTTEDSLDISMSITNLWKEIAGEGIDLTNFLQECSYDGLWSDGNLSPENILQGLRNCCSRQLGAKDFWRPKVPFVKDFLSFHSSCQLCYRKDQDDQLKYGGTLPIPRPLNKDGFCTNSNCGFHKYRQWQPEGIESSPYKHKMTCFSDYPEQPIEVK